MVIFKLVLIIIVILIGIIFGLAFAVILGLINSGNNIDDRTDWEEELDNHYRNGTSDDDFDFAQQKQKWKKDIN